MIYLDNASTTPVDKNIKEIINITLEKFGNPSNNYLLGHETKKVIERAREQVAKAIGAEPEEIYFTSGASESNSMAIAQRKNCWASPYEHHSILYNPKVEIKNNLEESILDIHENFDDLMISHMLVNNETGEIFDIASLLNLCDKKNILFHTDATQAIGKINIDVKSAKIKMLSLSGHKFNAPKGIGAIFIDKSITPITPIIFGGGQEKHLRGGTENVPYIVALGEALEMSIGKMCKSYFYYLKLKQAFIQKLSRYKNIDWRINSPQKSISSILNISFSGIEGEVLAAMLADKKIYVGTGSACDTGNFEPSHVLKAMNVPEKYINGAIRISFGPQNTIEEINKTVEEIVKSYRILTK